MHLRDTKGRKWTKEDSKNAIHCYFKSNATQGEFMKRMIEIWSESTKFDTRNQRLADQASWY